MEPVIVIKSGLNGYYAALIEYVADIGIDGVWEEVSKHMNQRHTYELAAIDARLWARADGYDVNI